MDERQSAERTLYVQSLTGRIIMPPKEGRELVFGRNRPEVHVGVGEDDPRVSRRHGKLLFEHGSWTVLATGRGPIRFAGDGRMLYAGEEPVPLPAGYVQLFVIGSSGREHVLEIRVSGPDRVARVQPDQHTIVPAPWPVDETEHTVLVVLARRYLQNDPQPAPQSWRQVSDELRHVVPDGGWTHRRAEHTVRAVRERLSAGAVPGLLAEEIEAPVGNKLNENLIAELRRTGTITPADLDRLDREHP